MRAMARRSRLQLFCPVSGLGEGADDLGVLERAPRAHGVCGLLDLGDQRLGTGEAKEIDDAVRLAPVHRLRPSIVAVAAA